MDREVHFFSLITDYLDGVSGRSLGSVAKTGAVWWYVPMSKTIPFKWRHFKPDVILLCVRWYLRYLISYHDLEEMMLDRGLPVDLTTLNRWVIRYSPETDQRSRAHLKLTNDSWRVRTVVSPSSAFDRFVD